MKYFVENLYVWTARLRKMNRPDCILDTLELTWLFEIPEECGRDAGSI